MYKKSKVLRLVEVNINDIDYENFVAVTVDGNIVKSVELFYTSCIGLNCINQIRSNTFREKKKKHAWHCKSCAIKLEWENTNYREKHEIALKLSNGTPEARARVSKQTQLNWATPEIRAKMMLNGLSPDVLAAVRAKAGHSNSLRWKDPEFLERMRRLWKPQTELFNHPTQGEIRLKSSWESIIVQHLVARNLTWFYEPQSFEISTGNIYIPDFYIENFDLWIEVKGRFFTDKINKWEYFVNEFPEHKKTIIQLAELKKIKNGTNIEDIIN